MKLIKIFLLREKCFSSESISFAASIYPGSRPERSAVGKDHYIFHCFICLLYLVPPSCNHELFRARLSTACLYNSLYSVALFTAGSLSEIPHHHKSDRPRLLWLSVFHGIPVAVFHNVIFCGHPPQIHLQAASPALLRLCFQNVLQLCFCSFCTRYSVYGSLNKQIYHTFLTSLGLTSCHVCLAGGITCKK